MNACAEGGSTAARLFIDTVGAHTAGSRYIDKPFGSNSPGGGSKSSVGSDGRARLGSADEVLEAKIMSFSDVSNPEAIKGICERKVPGWQRASRSSDSAGIEIRQLAEGLTNQLFKVTHADASHNRCVLFRVYGRDVGHFYDPGMEVRVFELLSDYGIAPQLIAKGDGWRIEEWHYAVAVPTRHMRFASIYCQVASHVGRFHKLHRRADFVARRAEVFGIKEESDIKPVCMSNLDTWVATASGIEFADVAQQRALDEALMRLGSCERAQFLEGRAASTSTSSGHFDIRREAAWLRDTISAEVSRAQQSA